MKIGSQVKFKEIDRINVLGYYDESNGIVHLEVVFKDGRNATINTGIDNIEYDCDFKLGDFVKAKSGLCMVIGRVVSSRCSDRKVVSDTGKVRICSFGSYIDVSYENCEKLSEDEIKAMERG